MSTHKNNGSMSYLWFVCLVAACGGLLFGYDMVVVSGTNTQVKALFSFSEWQLGFYTSSALWGCAVGAGLAGFIADAFGRKVTLMVASVLIFISAAWTGLAASAGFVIVARLLGGFGIGAATMICPLYISEISPENHRGRMVTLFQFTITIGIVMCVFANWGIIQFAEAHVGSNTLPAFWKWFAVEQNWRAMYFAEALPGVLFLVCAFFIPESPRWLVKKGRAEEAERILARVNGTDKARAVRSDIAAAVREESDVRFFDLFTQRLKMPLVITLLLCFLSEACGAATVFYYGPQLFEAAGFKLSDSLGGFSIIAIVNMVATVFALIYVDSAGRRKLLTVGAVGGLFSYLAIGTLFHLDAGRWLVIMAINAFIAFFACAIGPVKFVIASEVFPNRIRGKAIALATVCIWLTSAAVTMLFPIMRAHMKVGNIFYTFSTVLVLMLLYIKFLMPETKGRTIEDIERSWLSKHEEG